MKRARDSSGRCTFLTGKVGPIITKAVNTDMGRWLSCLMGRPALISDDAIKLDLPRDAR